MPGAWEAEDHAVSMIRPAPTRRSYRQDVVDIEANTAKVTTLAGSRPAVARIWVKPMAGTYKTECWYLHNLLAGRCIFRKWSKA